MSLIAPQVTACCRPIEDLSDTRENVEASHMTKRRIIYKIKVAVVYDIADVPR